MTPDQRDPANPARARPVLTRRGILAVVLVAGAAVAWLAWPRPKPVAAASATPVSTASALQTDLPIWATAIGTVQALNTVDVKVRVDGQLQSVSFAEGQDVSAGQVLAHLDPEPLKAELRKAEAARQKDQASLDNALLDLQRYTKLGQIGAATKQSVDTATAQVASLRAATAADDAQVHAARLQLGYTTITAPLSGRVGARQADAGSVVHANDASGLVTITQMQPITVAFSVPQDLLPDLLAAQASAPLAVTVATRGGERALAQGKLVFVDSRVDQNTGQIRLKAAFDNQDRALWPGELISVRLLLRTERQVVTVPSDAVVNTQDGQRIFVVKADQTVQLRPVRTGASADGKTEVRAGVRAGEAVVTDGQSRLNDGSKVAVRAAVAVAQADAGGQR
ncbi:multidrug transporter subunit MdtA [Pandoraea terrae]|uniref:Multidrug transporter subunit MdtA n=1 Tax=Pandoraea terrae TaxID=1537710 RepID=A0A5E4V782_9BURK|nr:efflux RND transporter periplasmic adaptor subunit [Pandoraea terrae]VVE06710.1 multidrug transporter subunit MdtA [Pandoraea terrae]